MDNRRTALMVLLLRNPHVLEGRQAGEYGTPNTGTVLAFGYGDGPHSHATGGEICELFGHAVGDPREEGRSTRK